MSDHLGACAGMERDVRVRGGARGREACSSCSSSSRFICSKAAARFASILVCDVIVPPARDATPRWTRCTCTCTCTRHTKMHMHMHTSHQDGHDGAAGDCRAGAGLEGHGLEAGPEVLVPCPRVRRAAPSVHVQVRGADGGERGPRRDGRDARSRPCGGHRGRRAWRASRSGR